MPSFDDILIYIIKKILIFLRYIYNLEDGYVLNAFKFKMMENPFSVLMNKFEQVIAINDGPRPLSGHRIVCDNTDMYVFGGYNPDSPDGSNQDYIPMFCNLWKYNYFKREWTNLECKNFPQEVASSAVILIDSYLIVYGGTGYPFGASCSNRLLVCNLKPKDNVYKFEEVPTSGIKPPPLYGQCIIQYDNYLYTIGGTTGFEYFMDIYRLDLLEKVWEPVYIRQNFDEKPRPRYRHEVALYEGKIFVFGGGEGSRVFGFMKVAAFDIHSKEWIFLKTYDKPSIDNSGFIPNRRRCFSLVQDPGNKALVYITGGYGGELVYKDTWRIDLRTMKWTRIHSLNLPYNMFFHSGSITPSGKVMQQGGIIANAGFTAGTRINYLFQAQITVPPLKSACWEVISHYYHNSETMNKLIREYGLPSEYASQL